jgi:tetratricopeptide (TPR) repeat protein
MEVSDKLAALLAAADDAPYFPPDAYEERGRLFVFRGLLLVLLAMIAHPNPALSLLGKIGHWENLQFPWIWTDHVLIAENILLHSSRGMLQFWLHPLTTGRSPLGGTTLFLESLLPGGASPGRVQLITLLAHAGNCLLIWVILRRLAGRGAWLAAAIFAVHPIEVQSVTWASRQADVLGTLAGLASLQYYLKLKEIHPPAPADFVVSPARGTPLRLATNAMFAVALLFWPSVAPLAAVFPLILWWKRGKLDRQDWLELSPVLLLAGMVASLGLLLSEYHHEGGPAAALGLVDRFIIGGRAICFYVESILVPWPLLFLYQRWQLSGDLWMLTFPLAAIGATVLLWWKRRSMETGPFTAVAAFLILVFPHVPMIRSDWTAYSFVADHLQYFAGIPLIALFAAALAWLFDRLPQINSHRAARLFGGGSLIAGFAAIAILNTLWYTDEANLWKNVIDNQPMSLTARAVLSQYYFERKQFMKADQFPPGVEARIDELKSLGGADAGGTVLAQLAQAELLESRRYYSSAIAIYSDILVIDPRNREAGRRIGIAYRERGDLPEALRCFRKAEEQFPTEDLLTEYGITLVQSGDIDKGIEKYRQAIRLNPNFVLARIRLSDALFAQHNFAESSKQLQIVSQIDPRNFDAFLSSGNDLEALGDYPAATRMLEAAVQIRSDSPEAYYHLGILREKQRFFGEAVDSFANAVKLKPDFKEAKEHLDALRAQFYGDH